MKSKKQTDNEEVERLLEKFRKLSDEQLKSLINLRVYSNSDSPNKKAFKAILQERGINRDDF